MKILGIDTSTQYLSLAIADGKEILAQYDERQGMRHSSILIPSIERLLKKVHLRLKDIDAIAFSIGPGSFTGLRIGVAACKAINMALGIPIVALPTLDVVAHNFLGAREEVLCPVIDAKKGKLYACFYEKKEGNPGRGKALKRLTGYLLIDVETLLKRIDRETLLFGDGIAVYGERCKKDPRVRISEKEWIPKARTVALLGLGKAERRRFADPDKLVPLYLHSQYCQVSKKRVQ